MIKSVKVRNLQSHKKTKVDFDPGVNVVIGESDKGKSALFRSMLLVLKNRPLGDGIRSWWGGDSLCTLEKGTGEIVTRHKTNKLNSYEVDDVEFKAVGAGPPPDEVLDVFNIHPDINIQSQDDPIFLLSSSPGDVAKLLNEVAGLEIIDQTLKNVNAKIRKANRDLKYEKEHKEELREQLKTFANLNKVDTALADCERLESGIDDTKAGIEDMLLTRESVLECYRRIARYEETLKPEPLVDELIQVAGDYGKVFVQAEKLRIKHQKILDLEESITEKQSQVDLIPKIDDILTISKTWTKVIRKKDLLSADLLDITKTNRTINGLKNDIKIQQGAWNKAMKGSCPLCGRSG